MQRRAFSFGAAAVALLRLARVDAAAEVRPWFWRARRGDATVYLLGAAEARDRSWFTSEIERAFDASSELWLETPLDPWPPALVQARAYDPDRTFFESLAPQVRVRAQAYVDDLAIERSTIERMRPWFAYYRINGAFWNKYPRASTTENPDAVLRGLARTSGKSIRHEFATGEDLMSFFASMPLAVQSQYIELLLDFLDDEKRGLNDVYFGWVEGTASSRALDRMRSKTPALHKYLQADRNLWWARHIDELLATSGTRFVLLGMNHVLGPEGVPTRLEQRRVEIEPMHTR